MVSRIGTRASRAADDQRPASPAPGYHGIVARISRSASGASAPSCCRLNGAESGSAAFGKIFVMTRTRRRAAAASVEPFLPWDGMQYAPLPAAQERLSADTPSEVLALGIDELVEGIWKPFIRSLTRAPQTLLHGDPHIGNTYVLPGGRVGFLDWQVLRRGNWSLDLGYFLQGALTTSDRREHEVALLEQYRDALGLPTAELPSADEIWLRYRASVAHGLCTWLATASAGELWQRAAIALALAQRYSMAYGDLNTAQALTEIDCG